MRASVHWAILSAAALSSCTTPPPAESLAKLDAMPDFCQGCTTYGELPGAGGTHCGVVALANALIWLSENGFPRLAADTGDEPVRQFEVIRILASADYVNTDVTKGSGPAALMAGLEKYVREKGYGIDLAYKGWRCRDRCLGATPDVEWLLANTRATSNLVLNVGWYTAATEAHAYTRFAGHYVTLAGYTHAPDGLTLYIHDPAVRSGMAKSSEACRLAPLEPDATLIDEAGHRRPGHGYFVLEGIRLKTGAACAIVDGAVAFTLQADAG